MQSSLVCTKQLLHVMYFKHRKAHPSCLDQQLLFHGQHGAVVAAIVDGGVAFSAKRHDNAAPSMIWNAVQLDEQLRDTVLNRRRRFEL